MYLLSSQKQWLKPHCAYIYVTALRYFMESAIMFNVHTVEYLTQSIHSTKIWHFFVKEKDRKHIFDIPFSWVLHGFTFDISHDLDVTSKLFVFNVTQHEIDDTFMPLSV